METFQKLVEWCTKYLPGIILSFVVGYKDGSEKTEELEKELLESETKRKLLENEITIDKTFNNADATSIVNGLARPDDSESDDSGSD